MRKRLLLLLTLASGVIFSGCNKDFGGDDNTDQSKYYIHNAVTSQIMVVLDPMNVAFRFNTLLHEANALRVDVNDPALSSQKSVLIGSNTTIELDNEGTYTLTFAGGAGDAGKDNIRTGKILIKTNGGLLNHSNTWDVEIQKTGNYSISFAGGTVSYMTDQYSITAQGDNKWNIDIIKCTTSLGGLDEESSSSEEGTSVASNRGVWSGGFTLIQDNNPGDQSLQGVENSTYSLDINNATGIRTMYISNLLDIATAQNKPLRFNALCAKNTIVGNGALTTVVYDEKGLLGYVFSTWQGTSLTDCSPQVELTLMNAEDLKK